MLNSRMITRLPVHSLTKHKSNNAVQCSLFSFSLCSVVYSLSFILWQFTARKKFNILILRYQYMEWSDVSIRGCLTEPLNILNYSKRDGEVWLQNMYMAKEKKKPQEVKDADEHENGFAPEISTFCCRVNIDLISQTRILWCHFKLLSHLKLFPHKEHK